MGWYSYRKAYAPIKNIISIDERRSIIARDRVSLHMAIKKLFLAIFDPRSSIVMSIVYCRLPGVVM